MADKYERIMELAKRRGFIWPFAEIYGGVRGFIDFGPLGTVLKHNIEEKWRRFFIHRHSDFIVEIETPIIMPAKVFEASGHLKHFTDYIVECTSCHRKFRADHLVASSTDIVEVESLSIEDLNRIIKDREVRCPECGGILDEVKTFNLLFKTTIGPYSENVGYARPEAAQGMFLAFKRVYESMRSKLPLGIAQIGRVMRNEISPRQGPIRLREFTIMEIELFFDPEQSSCPLFDNVKNIPLSIIPEDKVRKGLLKPISITAKKAVEEGYIVNEWQAYFMVLGKIFMESLGIPSEMQIFIDKPREERAHYSAQTFDQVVKLERWGYVEVAGYSYRTDYDLSRHMKFSGVDLRVYRQLDKKILKEKVTVKPNMKILGPKFKSKVRELLTSLNYDSLASELLSKGFVEVAGYKLSKDDFIISREKFEVGGIHFLPHVVEPSFGSDRVTYTVLEYAFHEKDGRIILKLPRDVAPIQVSVFPLVSKDGLPELATKIYRLLLEAGLRVEYDESGSIGRRYVRADEIGVPIAVTVDYDSLRDGSVTLRDRDTWRQVRIKISDLKERLLKYFEGSLCFEELGTPFKGR